METESRGTRGIVDLLLNRKSGLFELLTVTILLAVGVNIVSDTIPAVAALSPIATLGVGSALIGVAMVYLALKFIGARTFTRTYEAFLIYDSQQNDLVEVPRYEFAESIIHFFRGAFAENPALEAIWKKEPLSSIPEVLWGKKGEQAKRPKSMDIVAEAVEYNVLASLSAHLTDYFSQQGFTETDLRKHRRVDIPHVLLTNRFLELFSRPMQDRARFAEYATDEDEQEGAVTVWNEDGTIYEKLEIVLPKESRISRPKPNAVEIATNRFNVSVEVDFDGVSVNLPRGFGIYYLGITNSEGEAYFTRFQQFQVKVTISTKFRFGALLSPAGWEYYRWIDSFMGKLESELATDDFLSKLNWEAAYTSLMLSANRSKRRSQ